MSLNKQQSDKFKKVLEDRAAEIQKELSEFASKDNKAKGSFVSKFPDYGTKDDDNAQEVATYENRLSLENNFEKELRDIKNALRKIEGGSYGVCKYCKKDIGEARLKIRPTSTSCVECKKKFKGEA